MINKRELYQSIRDGDELTVRIIGEIDHHNAVGIRNDIDSEIYVCRPKRLIFDLSGVEFMDSSGLGLILGRFTTAKNIGGELIIRNPCKSVMRILKLAGAERILNIEYEDVK
jgi:stage II sporulation protein AA (anti-sigma F factor antagonist)